MDRISPTRRPTGQTVGNQRWRDLLFLHWPVAPQLLQDLLPAGLTIDTFDGKAYIGVVPFAMFGVRPWWLPKWMAFDFLETNVRTYVHYQGSGPGVYFFSLDAASWLAVQAARIGWSLPYYYAQMSMHKKAEQIEYKLTRSNNQSAMMDVSYTPLAPVDSSDPAGLPFFLAERYLLYTEKSSVLYRGQVYHTPYPLQQVRVEHCQQGLVQAAGVHGEFAMPPLAHYAAGVDVDIFPLLPVSRAKI